MKRPANKSSQNQLINRFVPFILGFYIIAVLLLFLAELRLFGLEDYFRATNQVLILLALLILPFLVFGMSRFIQTLKLKVSGAELDITLTEFQQDINRGVIDIEKNMLGQISTAEQALWPILAGYDVNNDRRLHESKIIIGAKQDVSQIFFANFLCQVIKKYVQNSSCELRIPNGGSLKNFADVKYSWIDMYIDFTGTCCQYFNINHRGKSDDEIIEELNNYSDQLGVEFLKPLGASEDYCLVMSAEKAEQNNVSSIRDLIISGPNLVFSADPEFLNRDDCYIGLRKYGVVFKSVNPCSVEERYKLMEADEADVFVGYETDPQLKRKDIYRLKDPDQFFPRYLAIPVVNSEALKKVVGLREAFEKIHNSITTDDLIQAVNLLKDNEPVQELVEGFISKID